MNIRFLETFLWLAKLQSVQRTAQKMHATQAAVSSRIASLEEVFGDRLFERHSGKVLLTEVGRNLTAYAERIVSLEGQMRQRALNVEAGTDTIRIGVCDLILHSWFPQVLKLAHRRFPSLELNITSDSHAHLRQMLRADALDLILHLEPPHGGGSVSVDLGSLELAWVASPKLGLGGHMPGASELAACRFIGAARDTALYEVLEQAAEKVLGHVPAIHALNSTLGMVRLTSDAWGVTVLPLAVMMEELYEGTLERLTLGALPSPRTYATYRQQPDARAPEIVALARQAAENFVTELH